VVSSHLELAPILGYKIGFSAPPELLPSVKPQCEVFTKLDDGLNWADAVIALRVQKERHDSENIFLLEDYREAYGLNLKRIQALKQDGLIMHPGPINYGIELESEILSDPRSCILKQVENGVFLREAIIRGLFN
jgi:aspartate carbamoyltransferase catalytic subunit